MNPLGLTEEQINKIEPVLLQRLGAISQSPAGRIEILVELEEFAGPAPPGPVRPDRPVRNQVEAVLGVSLPPEVEVTRFYDHLCSLVLRLPAGSIKPLFDLLNIKMISDITGDIKPTE